MTSTNDCELHLLEHSAAPMSEPGLFQLSPQAQAAWVRRGGRMPARLGERMHILVMLARPRTAVPNLIAYVLGYSYTAGPASVRCIAGAALACCIGFAANIHHAAALLEGNARNYPRRVLMVAKIGYRPVMLTWVLLLAAMMGTALALGVHFSIFMALALLGMQHSAPPARGQGRPILGLWVYAQSVVFPFLFGWTTQPGEMLQTLLASVAGGLTGQAAPAPEASLQSFRYLGMWFLVTLLYMAKGAIKNVSELDSARAAGVRNSATIYGTHAKAARVASLVTVFAYASLIALVALGLERPRALFALLWAGPVIANCLSLIRAHDRQAANAVLRMDTRLSTGFLATLVLLIAPTSISVTGVVAAGLLLFWTDVLGLNWLREVDLTEAGAV